MVNIASMPPRRIIFRANRETLALVVAASAAAFTLSYTIHARPPEQPAVETAEPRPPQHQWAGKLADLGQTRQPAAAEPMTSASLVVPKSALALPSAQPRKSRIDIGPGVTAKTPVVAREKPGHFDEIDRDMHHSRNLFSKLNPLDHLPSMSTLAKPFAVAGDTVSGWMKRF